MAATMPAPVVSTSPICGETLTKGNSSSSVPSTSMAPWTSIHVRKPMSAIAPPKTATAVNAWRLESGVYTDASTAMMIAAPRAAV